MPDELQATLVEHGVVAVGLFQITGHAVHNAWSLICAREASAAVECGVHM